MFPALQPERTVQVQYVVRNGIEEPVENLFKKNSDTLDSVEDGATYKRIVGVVSGQVSASSIADAAISTAKFAAGIRPVRIVSTLPGAGDVQGDTVFLTTDNKLYRWTGTAWTATVPSTDLVGTISSSQIADAAITTAKFAAGLRPVEVVSVLPAPGTQGRTVFLTTDNKIYRDTGTAWTVAVATADLSGQITTTQLADGSVTTVKLGDAQVTTSKIANQAVTSTQIANATITSTQLGSNSVTATQIADQAVVIGKVSGDVAQIFSPYREDFTQPVERRWVRKTGSGTLLQPQVTDSQTGGTVLRATGEVWLEWADNIPFDPNVLYRMKIRVRRTVDASDHASNLLYCGVAGVAADGVTYCNQTGANSFGSQHYIVLAATPVPLGSGWTEYVGYFKGTAAVGDSTSHSDPTNPGKLQSGVRYFRPLVLMNYPGTVNDGVYEVDVMEFPIDVMSSMGTRLAMGLNPDGTVVANKVVAGSIAAGAVVAGTIAASAVGTNELAANAVTAAKIAANTITAGQIAGNTITAAQIAGNTITAGQIQAGAIGTSELASRAITTDKLFVGSFDNLIPDPGFEQGDLANYGVEAVGATVAINTANPRSGTKCVTITPSAGASGALVAGGLSSDLTKHFAAAEGDQFYFEAWFRKDTTNAVTFTDIKIQFRSATGTTLQDTGPGGFQPTQVYTKRTWTATAPAGTAYVVFYIAFNSGNTNAILVDDLYARRMLTGSLVVDGTITAQQIAALTITAAQIAGNTITAAQIAGNTITAAQIAGNTITGGQIQAGAISTSQLAARAVSLEKLFVGSYDNLILDPGFEQVTNLASADGWSTIGYSNAGGTLSISTTFPRSGNQCVQFNPAGQTNTTAFGANGSEGVLSKHVAATEGDQFYFEFWARKVNTGTPCNVVAVIRFHNAANATISTVNGTTIAPTQVYQKINVSGTCPAGTAYVTFQINFVFVGGATELVNVDDAYARRMATGDIIVDGTITAQKLTVSTLSAITANLGTITAGAARDINSKFVVSFDNALITVTDSQAVPVVRAKFGKVNTGTTDYGIQVWDANGASILDFTGAKRIMAVPLQDQGKKTADFTLDLSTGLTQVVQLGASGLNITLSNPVDGGRYRIWFQQDTTGSRTFPNITNAVMYTNDTKPTLTTTPGAFDLFEFEYRGATSRFTCMPLQTNVLLPTPQVLSVTPSTVASSLIHNFSMPATVTAGDVLVMICGFTGTSGRTTPSGWNLVDSTSFIAVYSKIAVGTEGGTTVNVQTASAESGTAQVYRIHNSNGSVSAIGTTGINGTTADPLALTPGYTDRTLWIAVTRIAALNTFNTDPTNYSNVTQTDNSTVMRVRSLYRNAFVATEDPSAFTWTGTTSWAATTVAVRPPT